MVANIAGHKISGTCVNTGRIPTKTMVARAGVRPMIETYPLDAGNQLQLFSQTAGAV